jgi:ubiquinone/menaquinone biosynthesis C-methylase UbiE
VKRVADHYGRPRLIDAIDAALRAAGVDPEEPTLDHLAPVDHFHSLGHAATLELARLAGISADDEVLDIGGGLGGPARTLASQFGCRVTVLDLTPDFCRTGEILTRRLALDRLVRFRVGDALQPPFTPASFDVVWTQHSTMNIPDKPALYRHAHGLLRPGGRLAMHEIVAGPAGPPHFPVPWAF